MSHFEKYSHNIHIMTDKYNCSQIQAIIQYFDKVARHDCTVLFEN